MQGRSVTGGYCLNYIVVPTRAITRIALICLADIGIALLLALGPARSATAQPDTSWVRLYDGGGDSTDVAAAAVVDACGNIFVVGRTVDAFNINGFAVVKYTPDGKVAWANVQVGSAFRDGNQWDIAIDPTGNVCVTGVTYSPFSDSDYLTVKYSSAGAILWQRTYNGPANSIDGPWAICSDAAGNFYVTGGSIGSGTAYDCATIKYDPSGNVVWARRFNSGSEDAKDIAVDPLGNVYISGARYTGSSWDCLVVKYNSSGTFQWSREYGSPGDIYDVGWNITVDNASNAIMAATSGDPVTGHDYAVIKYLPNGDTAWVRRYNGTGNLDDSPNDVIADESGNIYVTGVSPGPGTGGDALTIKYYPNGDTAWVRRYNGSSNFWDWGHALYLDDSGGVYVAGGAYHSPNYDILVLRYDTAGAFDWGKVQDCQPSSDESAIAVFVDSYEDIQVVGSTAVPGDQEDFAVLRYSQCTCPCANDPVCDGILSDVTDVVQTLAVAFRNQAPEFDPECPYARTDVNCDCTVDIVDAVKVINVAFRNADPIAEFCYACPQ